MSLSPAMVIGLGQRDRGDDGVGPAVAEAVRGLRLADVSVVEHADPTALIHLWDGHEPVVVVDAVVAGNAPGTVHRLRTGTHLPPLPTAGWEAGGTHAFGLSAAVELARALDRLPRCLVVVGVEGASYEHGSDLSASVAGAVAAAVDAVLEELGVGDEECRR